VEISAGAAVVLSSCNLLRNLLPPKRPLPRLREDSVLVFTEPLSIPDLSEELLLEPNLEVVFEAGLGF